MTTRINLMNDYNLVAHERVLDSLQESLAVRFEGYGADAETARAKAALSERIQCPQAAVHFLVGGTQVNLTAISAFLRPHEAVIAPHTAHIATHETGAIEACGHKVLVHESPHGKLGPNEVIASVKQHTDEHMVKPRLVYLSQTTEYGTLYSQAELRALRAVCDEHDLLLYIDGARLAYALGSPHSDLTLPLLAELADAFYLGGTKNGLLFGEALVICNPSLQADFRHLIKQRGGLLAKGFLLGIQFNAFLKDDLYLELAATANALAAKLDGGLKALGYDFALQTETNQVFVIVDNAALPKLHEHLMFEEWQQLSSEQTTIRFVTTWKTTESDIQTVLDLMRPPAAPLASD
ncbi:MAG: aminotransferase class I/II-fold pyridoxal phosphate-dependent enzyme [Coriobacteriales bacterium]|jgi:threonine aldolase|nr:aminotransferase class I/II-fold pyridoxal phosphate-dependent enzyme [Coriobacteriales bacterium]